MKYKPYETLNDKIIKTIEENYLKDFHKEVKKFQIIMTGYNASKYKSLQVFKEYGWILKTPSFLNNWMSCSFKNMITTNVSFELLLFKNLKTGILESKNKISSDDVEKGYITIKVDENNKLFEQIEPIRKQLEYFNTYTRFRNKTLQYDVGYNGDRNEYIIYISYSLNLL